jgi:hypothetical protein
VLFDLGAGVGIDDDDDVVESRGVGVRGEQVDDGLAVLADRGELLHAAVTAGPAGGEDDEGWSLTHHDHLTIAEAHVIPAPKPVINAYSPALTRPFSRASWKARGIEELEVLP